MKNTIKEMHDLIRTLNLEEEACDVLKYSFQKNELPSKYFKGTSY